MNNPFESVRLAWESRAYRHIVLCPWHEEKTASCVVDLKKCVVHCLGCGHHAPIGEWFAQMAAVCREYEVEPLFLQSIHHAERQIARLQAESDRRTTVVEPKP